MTKPIDPKLAKFIAESKVKNRAYHGTQSDFKEFKSGPRNRLVKGIWFAQNPDDASFWAGKGEGANVIPVHLQLKNPASYEDYERMLKELPDEAKRTSAQRASQLKKRGYDGLVVGGSDGNDTYVALHKTQIKSAIGNRGTYDPTDPDITKAKGGSVNKDRFLEGSKVKERLYHGTNKNIRKFSHKLIGTQSGNRGFFGRGYYLSGDPEVANSYADTTGGNVMPLHVNLENPLVIEDKLSHKAAHALNHALETDAFKHGMQKEHVRSGLSTTMVDNPDVADMMTDRLMSRGYDGVVYGNNREVVAFHPHQIKSAIGNRGTYDTTKDDITMAKGGSIEPKKTVKAYKLFRVDQRQPGKLFPLFVHANQPVELDKWHEAQIGEMTGDKVKSKIGPLAFRPGWHAGDLPVATHIGEKSDPKLTAPDTRPANHVWAEVEMPDDVDWQSVANERGTNAQGRVVPVKAHITDQIPKGGHYRYKTNSNMTGNWLIGGAMKVNKVLSDKEVRAINKAAGVADLPRATPFPAKKFGFAKGGSTSMVVIPDHIKSEELANYRDPKSTKIADWKWRKMSDVRKDVPITEIPDYIQSGYGEFMKEQQARAKAGKLSPRDLLKAFTITQSSIGRGGLSHATATKTGMKLPNTGGEVRPEGAFAEWLGSPMGQKYLNAAEQGLIDPAALADIQQKFSPFGKHNQLIDQMAYAAHTIPGMSKGMNKAVTGSTEDYRDWAEGLKGIAGAKSGFIGSMLGRGDLPTLDARQLNLHTLPAKVGVGSIMSRGKGKGAREAVDRLIARQNAMSLKIDPSMAPHYQHLTHHAVWDAMGNNETTHDDLMRAMRGYKDGGEAKKAKYLESESKRLKLGQILPRDQRDENLRKFLADSKIKERLYHATPADIRDFKPGGLDPRVSGHAIWLSNDPKRTPAAHNIGSYDNPKSGVNVMPVHVQAKNPMVIDDKGMLDWAREVYGEGSPEFPYLMPKKWRDKVVEDYDSIILADPHGRGDPHEIIMFHPEKIKSAIGNRGTYDTNLAEITKKRGGKVTHAHHLKIEERPL